MVQIPRMHVLELSSLERRCWEVSWPSGGWLTRSKVLPCKKLRHWRIILSKFFYLFTLLHMSILPACMSVHRVHAWYPWNSEEDTRSLGTGVINSWELPCECWELNMALSERAVSALNYGAIFPVPGPWMALTGMLMDKSELDTGEKAQ